VVVQTKSAQTDGYEAVQIGLVEKTNPRGVSKPMQGHFRKAGVAPTRRVAEFGVSADEEWKAGDEVKASIFSAGEIVDVVGTSKGKGFAGVMKRYHFGGQPGSHGTERKHRSRGSISSRASNRGHTGKPKKGLRMAGHMGSDQVTTRNHPLVRVDPENNLLLIKGALPGPNGGLLFVRKSITAKLKKEEAK
jgi:large subunit ribosomal protein L3